MQNTSLPECLRVFVHRRVCYFFSCFIFLAVKIADSETEQDSALSSLPRALGAPLLMLVEELGRILTW